MSEYEVVIGLEIHVQLKTESKMFCSSSAVYFGEKPNSHLCPTCLGLPGALPVTNKKAIENAVKVGLALNCTINRFNKFDRKSYFYPDLPKGYQISQFDLPIAEDGFVRVEDKKVRVNRAHQEEDTGKLIHSKMVEQKVSLIDFNRSGVPLIEIVSEPDISSAAEAKAYAKKIHQTMRYIEVADVDMEKAGMRFDANVSIRPKGSNKFGTKVEIKNINSFNFLEKAINFEVNRQIEVLKSGGKIIQETRGWVESKGETVSQRSKETSPDYRYFPDPDLPPLEISEEQIDEIKQTLPELPDAKIERFKKTYQLSDYDASLLTEDKDLADWFEKAAEVYSKAEKEPVSPQKAKKVANWILGELLRYLKEKSLLINQIKAEPASLAELLVLIDRGVVTGSSAKLTFSKMLESGEMPAKVIDELDLKQVSDSSVLSGFIREVISENPQAVEDFKKGKQSASGFLIGKLMQKTKGNANPNLAREELEKALKES